MSMTVYSKTFGSAEIMTDCSSAVANVNRPNDEYFVTLEINEDDWWAVEDLRELAEHLNDIADRLEEEDA